MLLSAKAHSSGSRKAAKSGSCSVAGQLPVLLAPLVLVAGATAVLGPGYVCCSCSPCCCCWWCGEPAVRSWSWEPIVLFVLILTLLSSAKQLLGAVCCSWPAWWGLSGELLPATACACRTPAVLRHAPDGSVPSETDAVVACTDPPAAVGVACAEVTSKLPAGLLLVLLQLRPSSNNVAL